MEMAQPIKGTKASDLNLTGTNGDDNLQGKDGNDITTGGKGNDNIDGGNGIDTAVYAGNFSTASRSKAPATTRSR
jgi:Ca2+-binding RTX toxin-like protein